MSLKGRFLDLNICICMYVHVCMYVCVCVCVCVSVRAYVRTYILSRKVYYVTVIKFHFNSITLVVKYSYIGR